MLVLTRKKNETIAIGADIAVTVLKIDGGKVRLGISAPLETPIARAELLPGAAANQGHHAASAHTAT